MSTIHRRRYFHVDSAAPEGQPALLVQHVDSLHQLAWPVTVVVDGQVARAQLAHELLTLAARLDGMSDAAFERMSE